MVCQKQNSTEQKKISLIYYYLLLQITFILLQKIKINKYIINQNQIKQIFLQHILVELVFMEIYKNRTDRVQTNREQDSGSSRRALALSTRADPALSPYIMHHSLQFSYYRKTPFINTSYESRVGFIRGGLEERKKLETMGKVQRARGVVWCGVVWRGVHQLSPLFLHFLCDREK